MKFRHEMPRERHAPRRGRARNSRRAGARGFSLIELLVVIAIIGILAALLFPALSAAKAKVKQTGCLNHLRQFTVSLQMYSGDNTGLLVENLPIPRNKNSWVASDMRYAPTNTAEIRAGSLFRYLNETDMYRCPAEEKAQALSYSMNGWMGSRVMETQYQQKGYRTFIRDSEIAAAPAPAGLWVIADEHTTTIDDGWFLVRMDDYQPFASFPGIRHRGAFGINFADGHATTLKLRDPTSRVGASVSYMNSDWLRFKEMTTTR